MYELIEVLHEGQRFRLTRERRITDGASVIIKQLRAVWPRESDLARFRKEFDMLDAAGTACAPAALAFEVQNGVARIVMEDLGATPLTARVTAGRLTVREFLPLALGAAQAIEEAHRRHIVHRDVNPSNLVEVRALGRVALIDFGLASRIGRGATSPRPLASIEGTPPYLAPEQTGRMNRLVDGRADLYALGASFYELLSGRPPFQCDDLLEYVHAHLAREPAPLDEALATLPKSLSAMVATLLRKRPEERYQSATGLCLDLRRMIAALKSGASLDTLDLVGRSVADRPEMPQHLHGREEEIARLQGLLADVVRGGRAAAMISGEPGIGKTSLVFELQRPATLAGARVLLGKFDQFSRDVPLAALAQAFAGFVTEVLSEPMEAVSAWRERLVAAVGRNARLLTDLVPDADALLGEQPAVDDLGPTESEQRLQETFRRAFREVAGPGHAMVLFLDDLQWADLASLRLIETLFRDAELGHLLLIGAWRDTEVAAQHALQTTLTALRTSGTPLVQLHLGPLRQGDVESMLGSAFHRGPDETRELAALLHQKTHGNPFFLRRIVEELGDAGALHFDSASLGWQWDLAAAREHAITDNVVTFLHRDLARLPSDARRCLAAAAWIGARFDFDLLMVATTLEPRALLDGLRSAIDRRFVAPIESDYWDDESSAPGQRLAFVHDRIQQAAGELLSADDVARVRITLARAILARRDHSTDTDLFRVVEHFNASGELHDDAERQQVIALNLEAGRRAIKSAAYVPAHRFLEAATRLAGPSFWERDPAQAYELGLLSARAAWLVGNDALMRARVEELIARATTPVARLDAEWVLVQSQIARWELQEGITLAIEALARVGVELPRHPSMADVMNGIGAALHTIGARSIDELADLPIIDDALEGSARRMMTGISSAAYVATPNLLPLLSAELVRRTVVRGVSRESSYGFGVFALSLCAGWHLGLGYEYGKLALRLLARVPDVGMGGRTRHVVNAFVRPWTEAPRQIYVESPELARALMDVGDLEYAAWVLEAQAIYGYFSGVALDELAGVIDRMVVLMRQHKLDAGLHCTVQFQMTVRALRGELEHPARLVGEGYDEVLALARYRETGFRAAALVLSVNMLNARVLLRDYVGALDAVALAFEFQDGAAAVFYQATMRVMAAIAALSCLGELSDEARGDRIAEVLVWRKEVAAAAEHAPRNLAHLLCLFDAEIASARRDAATAIDRYDEAITKAAAGGFVHDEALANERAGLFHLQRGARSVARSYLQEARFAFQRWGAHAKVAQLEALHADLLVPSRSVSIAPTTLDKSTEVSGTSLDLDTILKASQAISGEVALDGLLTRALKILLENVGARKAVLLLRTRGALCIEAEGASDHDQVELFGGIAFEDGQRVPPTIVRRVWRTGKAEVYDDIAQAPEFSADP